MWIPKNEFEIQTAVSTGTLEETATFDAKRELPDKNLDIAKDVAAMANDGGVIIYGIGEDAYKQLTVLNPIPLAGASERIDSIVRTSIAEPPTIQIISIPTTENPAIGYIVVVIPPSERAPHMVVVKGEYRFYGRSDKSNQPLTEGEVARLYQRRQRWAVDRDAMLAQEIIRYDIVQSPDFAYIYLAAWPVVRDDKLLQKVFPENHKLQTVLQKLVEFVSKRKIFPEDFTPQFRPPNQWQLMVEGYFAHLDMPAGNDKDKAPRYMLDLQIDFDGSGHLFCGRAAERYEGQLLFFVNIVAGNTLRFLILLGELYNKLGYFGMIDLGVALTGLKGCVLQHNRLSEKPRPYHENQYRKTLRVSALQLKNDPVMTAQELLMPLFNAISQGRVNPFSKLIE